MRSIGYNSSAVSEMNHLSVYLWKWVLGEHPDNHTQVLCEVRVCCLRSALPWGHQGRSLGYGTTCTTQADRRTDRWTHATATFRRSSSAKCTVAIRCDAFLGCKSIFQQRRPTDDHLRPPLPPPPPVPTNKRLIGVFTHDTAVQESAPLAGPCAQRNRAWALTSRPLGDF